MDTPDGIVSRTHLPGDVTQVVFRSGHGLRLGRIYPVSPPPGGVSALLSWLKGRRPEGVVLPDDFRLLDGGRVCLSLPLQTEPRTPVGPLPASLLVERLESLRRCGIGCLALDRGSLLEMDGELRLAFWGGDILRLGGVPAPEVAEGGYAGDWSTAWALGQLFRDAPRLLEHGLGETRLRALLSPIPSRRSRAAVKLGLAAWPMPEGCDRLPEPGLSVVCGGPWRMRACAVNDLAGLAESRGMRVRIVRCSSQESHRPLPDVEPGGGPILNPGDLLSRLFGPASDMDRLLVFDDAHRASPDLAAMLKRLAMLPPPGLRLVISAPEQPDFVPQAQRTVVLEGEAGEADDLPLRQCSGELEGCGQPEPSWSGPRIRCPGKSENVALPEAHRLYAMGADRVAASLAPALSSDDEDSLPVAASLIRLGRWREALRLLPEHAALLRGQALLGLGKASEAVPLLRSAFEEEPGDRSRCLLARALVAAGSSAEAEDLLRHGRSAGSAVALADLLDSLGRPAEAIGPLRRVAEEGSEATPEVLCAQARIYMRLGRYAEALERTDRAVAIAGSLGESQALVEGLLTRGRTREVLGDWKEALGDYRMAVSLFDAASSSAERSPHVDLYVLLLRTGRLGEADGIWDRMLAAMRTSGGAAPRMEQMLLAYRAVLLGRGEEGLPFARRSAEMATAEGNPLHQALSAMYAGVLTVQAGRTGEGLDTIRRARARAGMLGDRHLQLMCDLELLAAGDMGPGEDLRLAAGELGLVPEELRAAVIQHGDAGALESLLELPAPLEALAAARCMSSLPPALAAGLRQTLSSLTESLPEGEAESLAELCRGLPGGPGGTEVDGAAVLREVSGWARRRLAEGASLRELAESLGIGCLDTAPSEGCSVQLSGEPPLYASSPVPGLEDAAALVAALASATVEEAGTAPRSADYPELVGGSRAMRELRAALDRAIGCSAPVLLLGETGTGKELAARAIHRGRDAEGPFVPLDCGAIPPELLESELFGARRGAYTGLREDRKGLIEEARGGTLFLDEIGNLTGALQVKLLRALDTGRFRRLGENRERESSFRLVAATNRDLRRAVARGDFRDDLYYRIAVMVIELPPLRGRRGDIPLLARYFLRQEAADGKVEITAGALRKLEEHGWPGNVRELRNVMQRALALSGGGDIHRRHIHLSELRPGGASGRMETVRAATARHVRRVVEEMGGNRTRAAEVLDCDPKTVRKYLRIAEEELGQRER